ncbi:MAG TPA: hypothetical protein VK137_00970, partial [Planctomycetaceae bacterium]|nr:hypothetical protein [Planctomycetaceae bacterium]
SAPMIQADDFDRQEDHGRGDSAVSRRSNTPTPTETEAADDAEQFRAGVSSVLDAMLVALTISNLDDSPLARRFSRRRNARPRYLT